jgi:hypothetical protein
MPFFDKHRPISDIELAFRPIRAVFSDAKRKARTANRVCVGTIAIPFAGEYPLRQSDDKVCHQQSGDVD